MGEMTSGVSTWNVICTDAVARDGDTSISISHSFPDPSERKFKIRVLNFNSGRVSVS